MLALLAGHAAHAQSTWTNAGGGDWGNPLNWDNNNVPNTAGESAIILPAGPYTVFFDNNYTINALTIAHSLARVDLQNNLSVALFGGIDTAGILTVNNAAGPNPTFLRVGASQTWSGGGDIVLNANPSSLDTAYIYFNGGGEVLTLAAGTEILGSGRIYVNTVNNGGIVADSFGRTLELLSQSKTNNNEFAAVNGGILRLSGISVPQGSSGIVRALTGSTVSIFNSSVSGGEIRTEVGGATQFSGISTLTSLATFGLLDVLNGNELRIATSLVNDGDIRINSGIEPNATLARIMNNTSLTGVGSITLRSIGLSLDTAYLFYNGGGEILTQGAQHTIRGSGNIYVGTVNNGTIAATTPGRSLRLLGVAKTNNKDIRADSGRIEIDSTTITQGVSGVISLTSNVDASLVFRNAVINSGLVQATANSITNEGTSTFTNTTISGPFTVLNSTEMRLAGAATSHSGDLFVNSGSGVNVTLVRIMQNHVLSGPGRIVLRADPSSLDTAYLQYNGGGEVLSQSAGHSIVGTGNVYVGVNNVGTIDADQSGRILNLTGVGKQNSGVMKSTGGGILGITNIDVTQTGGGVLRADAGELRIAGSTINGGLVESINGGMCNFTGTSRFNGVSFAGIGNVPNNNELRIAGGTFVNNGTLTINPSASNNATLLRIMVSELLSGSGSIVLNANVGSLDTSYLLYNGGGEILTQSAGHTIRGSGRVYVGLTNNGLLSADAAGRTLDLTGVTKTNNSIFEAVSGGILQFTGVTVNQSPGATIRSASGGSLNFVGSVISGGSVQTASSALSDAASFSGTTTLSGVTLQGAGKVLNNNELRINSAGIINDGVLTINATAGVNGTLLRVQASSVIDGTGTVLLNANASSLDTAYLLYNGGGEILTLGPGQTLAGTGRVYVRTINYGTVAPGGTTNGNAIGFIGLASGRFTQQTDGIMAFEIAGPAPAQFDRLVGSATIDLNGALLPSLINNYDPPIGTAYDIIDGPAVVGTFSSIGPGFTVQYFPTKVRVIYTGPTCPADLNHDGVVDDADFVIFVPAYNILDCTDPSMPPGCPADMNRDGFVDDIDFVIFLAQYNELLCP